MDVRVVHYIFHSSSTSCSITWLTKLLYGILTVRTALFCFYKTVFLVKSKALEMVLLDLPNLLFFSTYILLVLFWAEIYYQARSLPINKLRPAYYSINGFIYLAQECIWISIRLSKSPIAIELASLHFKCISLHFAVVSLCAASGFILYGGRLFYMLRRFPIESRGSQKKLFEVGFVTGICCACFVLRCLMVLVSAFDEDADVDVLYHPLLNLIYYMLVEILPSALVLFILRKLPPKRVSDKHRPIK
ncbi:tobamovirus multiplication protein 1-like [Hibiscus syriacus]|uniref:tobamovirus multiplication protein 1-like n=1 Tax=Hibiscus syriacus TaxID=106335 RepID=UPI001922CAB6|nr:tobamovirus multiplication protein 1-like [Hibiscus syriacus]